MLSYVHSRFVRLKTGYFGNSILESFYLFFFVLFYHVTMNILAGVADGND